MTSTFDRLNAWLGLFVKRKDITFSREPDLSPAKKPVGPVPGDIAAMAKKTSAIKMEYKLPEPRPMPNRSDPDGFIFLSFQGITTDVALDIPEKGKFESALELDNDMLGTGKAAFYVASAKEPFVVYDVDEPVCFPSLEAYITAGARLAFCDSLPGGSWQKNPDAEHPLLTRCPPKSTPLPKLREALVKKGAKPIMADILIEWLGADTVLLLEK